MLGNLTKGNQLDYNTRVKIIFAYDIHLSKLRINPNIVANPCVNSLL